MKENIQDKENVISRKEKNIYIEKHRETERNGKENEKQEKRKKERKKEGMVNL